MNLLERKAIIFYKYIKFVENYKGKKPLILNKKQMIKKRYLQNLKINVQKMCITRAQKKDPLLKRSPL